MIKKLFATIVCLGIKESMDLDEIRRIKISNKIKLIALFSSFFFLPIDIIYGLDFLTYSLASGVVMILFSLYLSTKNMSDLSSWIFIMSFSAILLGNQYFLKTEVGSLYILLAMVGLPVIMIDSKKKLLFISAILVPSVAFTFSAIFDFTTVGIYSLENGKHYPILWGTVLDAVVIILSQLYLFTKEMDFRYEKYQQQQHHILQQGRMSDVGIMAAGIAHEINNPLTIIKSYSTLLEKKTKQLDEQKTRGEFLKYLDKISENIDRIGKIIKGIKFLSRDGQHDTFELVLAQDIIGDIEEVFSSRLASLGIDYQVKILDPGLSFECRRAQIEQVLVSLLSNAIDALVDINDALIIICVSEENGQIVISIEDNGKGVDAKDAPKIMKTFYSTKEIGKGTGLGLSISTQIVESHGGTLSLVSRKPAIFVIKIPKTRVL